MSQTIRRKNNSPRLLPSAVSISMLADPSRGGRREVLLDGRLEVISWKGVPPTDRMLLEAAIETPGTRILAAMTGSAMPGLAMARLRPQAVVTYYHIDVFHMSSARNLMARHEAPDAMRLVCEPTIPRPGADAPAPDLVLANVHMDSEVGLTLELLHQVHHRLERGGKLLIAINNPRDTWLADKLEKIFGNLTRAGRDKRAILYSVKKKDSVSAGDEAAAARELFIQEVEVEEAGQKLMFDACYGTFSSTKLDDGSGALLHELELPETCRRVLDLGCGWGGLGILTARRAGAELLMMIDANARATEMARRNAERHLPGRAEIRLEANVESLDREPELAGSFDLVVGNPPYGTEFRVSELFLNAAHKALRPGGRIYLVAKNNQRLFERTGEIFGNVGETRRWGYQVVSATREQRAAEARGGGAATP